MSEPTAKPIDYQAERCGHNFPPEQCPYDDCGYREALARIAELEAEKEQCATETGCHHAEVGGAVCH